MQWWVLQKRHQKPYQSLVSVFRVVFPVGRYQVQEQYPGIPVRKWCHYQNTGNNNRKNSGERPVEVNGYYAEYNHDGGAERIADVHGTPEKTRFVFKFEAAMAAVIIGFTELEDIQNRTWKYASPSAARALAGNNGKRERWYFRRHCL